MSTAALDDAARSAWCREHGVFPAELGQWHASATAALGDAGTSARPQTARADRLRIKELERDLSRCKVSATAM